MTPTSRNRSKKPSTRERARRGFQSTLAGRVSNNELRRRAERSILYGRQAYSTLLAVLAQKGGEVTITQGTLDQVNTNYNDLGFVVERKGDSNEYVVKLVEGRAQPVGDSLSVGQEVTPAAVAPGTEDALEDTRGRTDVDGRLGRTEAGDVSAGL